MLSRRRDTPAGPLPSGPIAVTLTDDCDPPSWLMASGIALTFSVSARPDGPVSGGGSVFLTVQPAAARRASATAARRMYVDGMALEVPKITEIDRNLSRDLNLVADAVDAVEGDLRDRRDDVRTRLELHQRRLFLRDVPDDLERHRQRTARLDRAGDRSLERVRDVDALRV